MCLNLNHSPHILPYDTYFLFFIALGQNNDKFDSCPLEALEWKRRRCHMLEEILRYNPDVICLQVDILNKKIIYILQDFTFICISLGS